MTAKTHEPTKTLPENIPRRIFEEGGDVGRGCDF